MHEVIFSEPGDLGGRWGVISGPRSNEDHLAVLKRWPIHSQAERGQRVTPPVRSWQNGLQIANHPTPPPAAHAHSLGCTASAKRCSDPSPAASLEEPPPPAQTLSSRTQKIKATRKQRGQVARAKPTIFKTEGSTNPRQFCLGGCKTLSQSDKRKCQSGYLLATWISSLQD